MKTSPRLATRFPYLTALLLSFPFVTGADDNGCAHGGDVPVGSNGGDAGLCTPEICRDLPRQLDAKICADGTSLERSVCTVGPAGRCGWEFPDCPAPTDAGQTDAQPPSCQPTACQGLPVLDDARVCPDGTTLFRSVCAPSASGACHWDFPACADKADAAVCSEADCAGQPRDSDARICPDGTVVARTTCAPNDEGHCFWDFPPCAK